MQLSGWNQLTIPRLRLDKLKVQNHCLVKYAELNDVNCIKIFHSYPTALGLKFTNMPFALKGMFVNFKPNAVGYDQKMATVLCSLPENRQGTHWHCTLKIKIKKTNNKTGQSWSFAWGDQVPQFITMSTYRAKMWTFCRQMPTTFIKKKLIRSK